MSEHNIPIEQLEAFGQQLEQLVERVNELRSTCRETLQLDRRLDIDQSWPIHHLAKAIAARLDGKEQESAIESVISTWLLEQRLELRPIVSPEEGKEER